MDSSYCTGYFGCVIIPDEKTRELAKKLSRGVSVKAEYFVDKPHITLYHTKFTDVSEKVIKITLDKLSFLIGKPFTLDRISPYGEKFLFWDIAKPYKNIQRAHELVVRSFLKFHKKEGLALAKKEGLRMSTKERGYAEKYGYPLVHELFRPHIALLYSSSGIEYKGTQIFKGEIKKVQFIQEGKYGSIKEVLYSTG